MIVNIQRLSTRRCIFQYIGVLVNLPRRERRSPPPAGKRRSHSFVLPKTCPTLNSYIRCTGEKMKAVERSSGSERAHASLQDQPQPALTPVFLPPMLHSLMILPQVHLRKPCYDFYFL